MTKDEALKLALEALENVTEDYVKDRQYIHNKAITAIRKALAQPEQEPVAWMTPTGALYRTEDVDGCFDETHIPLYTTPPQRKPLTDEEIDAIYTGVRAVHHEIDSYVFARAIEAAHGIKGEA